MALTHIKINQSTQISRQSVDFEHIQIKLLARELVPFSRLFLIFHFGFLLSNFTGHNLYFNTHNILRGAFQINERKSIEYIVESINRKCHILFDWCELVFVSLVQKSFNCCMSLTMHFRFNSFFVYLILNNYYVSKWKFRVFVSCVPALTWFFLHLVSFHYRYKYN